MRGRRVKSEEKKIYREEESEVVDYKLKVKERLTER